MHVSFFSLTAASKHECARAEVRACEGEVGQAGMLDSGQSPTCASWHFRKELEEAWPSLASDHEKGTTDAHELADLRSRVLVQCTLA